MNNDTQQNRRDLIFKSIGNIGDDLITEASELSAEQFSGYFTGLSRKIFRRGPVIAIAACICIVCISLAAFEHGMFGGLLKGNDKSCSEEEVGTQCAATSDIHDEKSTVHAAENTTDESGTLTEDTPNGIIVGERRVKAVSVTSKRVELELTVGKREKTMTAFRVIDSTGKVISVTTDSEYTPFDADKIITEGLGITVNGEPCDSLPEEAGKYVIVFDLSEAVPDGNIEGIYINGHEGAVNDK